jgi:hypothetical protein
MQYFEKRTVRLARVRHCESVGNVFFLYFQFRGAAKIDASVIIGSAAQQIPD